jgi:ribosome biogenesis protein Tsr3
MGPLCFPLVSRLIPSKVSANPSRYGLGFRLDCMILKHLLPSA